MTSLLLAALGVLGVVVGVSMIYLPAGVIVSGVLLVVAGYVSRYVEVHNDEAP